MAGCDNKHANYWNSSSHVIANAAWDSPVIVFNLTQRGSGDTVILSSFSNFMATSLSQRQEGSYAALEYGVTGSMITVPANYTQSFIVFYSSNGINKGVREWGQTMQRAFNRTQQHRLNDVSLNYMGYYMDNGAYYFHNTMPGTNYEDTTINIVNQIQLPIHYMEISAYFYYKGVAGGVSDWSPRPEVFPHGIPYLHNRINLPFIIHNRYWAYDAVYQKNYSWILDPKTGLSLPASNDSFWFDLLTKAKEWGVILYQQDWLNYEYFLLEQAYTDIHLTNRWLTSMGEAADQLDINIHYIMSYPRHFLKALEVPRVTQIRVSEDYAGNLGSSNNPQWNIGVTSMIVDALGLAPNKDVLWSTSIQPNNPYGDNAHESLPDRAIFIATLSTGPIAIGDAVNLTNVERIMRCCRQDGLILKPDRAITIINAIAADWARYNSVPQGELYSTETTIPSTNNDTFHVIFASRMRQDYDIYPSMIDGQPGIVWYYNNITHISSFNHTSPFHVSHDNCHDNSFCVWYTSPLWQFNDVNRTEYALLGESNKWTVVSRQRFLSITTNTENTRTTIVIQGIISEIVSIGIYHSILQSTIVNCSITAENGQANLILTPTNAICS